MGNVTTIAITVIWFALAACAGLAGKVKIGDQPLPPVLGAIVAPFLMLFLGAMFVIVGALMTVPAWIWLVR